MARTFVWHRTRGPKTTAKDVAAGTGEVQIKQVRSDIGRSLTMRRTLEAIGLKHHQDVVVKQDSESLRGQLKKVRHLIEVTDVEGTSGKKKATQGKKRG
jgi:large subunit ribosomal protein L30